MPEMVRLELLKYAKSIAVERTLPANPCLIPFNCKPEQGNCNGLILVIQSILS